MSPRFLIRYCGVLLSISAFSVDILLPFFPVMRVQLAAPYPSVQATVTLYILCLGIGQLLFGSLSDRFGRRPAIAAGLSLYLVGALIGLLSGTIDGLLVGRICQGLGAAVGPVVGRAVIRDRFTGQALAQNMAIASGIFSIGPIFAPLIGVALAQLGGSWRTVFVAMLAFALLLLAGLTRMPETLARKRRDALSPAVLLANMRVVLTNRQSRYFLLVSAWTSGAMVAIVSGMPRVMETEWGVGGTLFALLFAIHGLGIVIGQFANHRMIARIGPVASAVVAARVMTGAFVVSVLAALAGWQSPWLLAFLVFVFALGFLIVVANSTAMTLEPHGAIAGFTSSFFGFVAQGLGAGIGSLVSMTTGGHVLPWSLLLLGLCAGCLLALLHWQRTGKATGRVRQAAG